MEASTNTWALAELLGRHAGRVVVSNPLRTRAIADAKRKTDDIDAATLAELLAADYLPEVWVPDETTRRLRRLVAHRAGLVRAKHRALDRMAGQAASGTRSPQRGATGSGHDRGRTRLRGGDDPHHPTLRQAVDRVRPDDTPGRPADPGA